MAMIGKKPTPDPMAEISPELLAAGSQPLSSDQSGPMPAMPNIPQAHQRQPIGWLGILGDGLLGAAGKPGIYGPMMAERQNAQTAFERGEQQYNAHAATDLQRLKDMARYNFDNPNSELDQAIRQAQAHSAPGDPLGPIYNAYMWNKATPPQMVTQTDGTTGMTTTGMIRAPIPAGAVPPGGMTEAQLLAMGAKPQGGPGLPAPATFRR